MWQLYFQPPVHGKSLAADLAFSQSLVAGWLRCTGYDAEPNKSGKHGKWMNMNIDKY